MEGLILIYLIVAAWLFIFCVICWWIGIYNRIDERIDTYVPEETEEKYTEIAETEIIKIIEQSVDAFEMLVDTYGWMSLIEFDNIDMFITFHMDTETGGMQFSTIDKVEYFYTQRDIYGWKYLGTRMELIWRKYKPIKHRREFENSVVKKQFGWLFGKGNT